MRPDSFDAELDRHVAPPDWVNPRPQRRYHLVVIGAGPAGLVAAAGAASLGARVALIEKQRLGGDCLNEGCVPSKALLKSARVAATVRRSAEFGVTACGEARVDFAAVMERMRELRRSLAVHDSATRFRELGVDVFFGTGRFTSADVLEVGGQSLRFRRALIATGTRAKVPAIPGLSNVRFFTNETVFSLKSLPSRLMVLGAGPVGCELAQAFARFGSAVTLVASRGQILPKEDAEAAAVVEATLRHEGVEILKSAHVESVAGQGNETHVRIAVGGSNALETRVAEELLVAVGRTPNVHDLGLEAAGIDFDPRDGVRVDDRLRTTNPRVFAAGDVCSRFKFTHAADAMARLVLQNALFPGRGKVSSLVIPRCTFTDPEIATVGLTESEAQQKGLAVDVLTEELRHNDRAVLDDETNGFAKVLLRRGTDEIVGATIVASHAGELLNELTLAMTARLGLRSLAASIRSYPTQGEVVKRLADQFQRRRLTPMVRRWLKRWFEWTS